jgi:hypothetical protein
LQIVDASFSARDPEGLARWFDESLGAAPTFSAGESGPHHFAFHVADLEPWKTRLDVTEEHDFSSWGGAHAVYFRDPEDNVVELIARPQAHLELALAEVGLPVEDVPAAVDALRQAFDLPVYREAGETFTPLGDDDGLLILVRTGRGWFPYDVPAPNAPVIVTIAGARSGELDVPGSRHRVLSVPA